MPHLTSRSEGTTTRRVGVALALAGWLAIALATLTPTRGGGATAAPGCVACDLGWGADLLANVLLFLPLGAGLALAGVRARRAVVAVVVTSVTVELLQVAFVAGRDASLRDLATNVAGGAAGWLVASRRGWLLGARPAVAAGLAAAWSATWVAGTAISAWAFTPSLPASLWWAHWRAASSSAAAEPLVLDTRVGDERLGPGSLDQWPSLRRRLLAGEAITMRAVVAPSDTANDGEIAVVDDADTEQELLSFRRRGDGVAFYFRTRGAALRLRSPAITTGDFLAGGGADTVRLAGAFSHGRLRVGAEHHDGVRTSRTLEVTPNLGWSFFAPPGYAFGRETRLLTVIWVAALVLPVGYWAARGLAATSASTRAVARAALIAPAVALVAVPLTYALPPVHWSEWLAWALGSAAGVGVARGRVRRRGLSVVGADATGSTRADVARSSLTAAATSAPAAWRAATISSTAGVRE